MTGTLSYTNIVWYSNDNLRQDEYFFLNFSLVSFGKSEKTNKRRRPHSSQSLAMDMNDCCHIWSHSATIRLRAISYYNIPTTPYHTSYYPVVGVISSHMWTGVWIYKCKLFRPLWMSEWVSKHMNQTKNTEQSFNVQVYGEKVRSTLSADQYLTY